MSKPEEYGICVRLIKQDDVEMYAASVAELPDLWVYEDTFDAAYKEMLDAIETAQEMFAENGCAFRPPNPLK